MELGMYSYYHPFLKKNVTKILPKIVLFWLVRTEWIAKRYDITWCAKSHSWKLIPQKLGKIEMSG